MKILDIKELAFPEVKVVRFQRFRDERGYFTEVYRLSDLKADPRSQFLKNTDFVQCNESFSRKHVLRGMHFQWEPPLGKLVRTLFGHMIDLIMDIRKDSPTYGKLIAYNMPSSSDNDFGDLIWIPPGFAHGNCYLEDTKIEYFCTSEWNPQGEASITLFDPLIDWSLCDPALLNNVKSIMQNNPSISEKDRNGYTIQEWLNNPNSQTFTYQPTS